MSAAAQTRIFGVRLKVDPKVIVIGLIAIAALLWWYNSRNDEDTGTSSGSVSQPAAAPVVAPKLRPVPTRRETSGNNRGTLRLRPVDATHGDIDPTLRLNLLSRLQSVAPGGEGRNLFEVAAAPVVPPKAARTDHTRAPEARERYPGHADIRRIQARWR